MGAVSDATAAGILGWGMHSPGSGMASWRLGRVPLLLHTPLTARGMELLFSLAPGKSPAPWVRLLSSVWASEPPRSLPGMVTGGCLPRPSSPSLNLTDTSDEGALVQAEAPLLIRSLLATLWKRARRERGSIRIETWSQPGPRKEGIDFGP